MSEPTKTDIFFSELASLEATVLVLNDRYNELNNRLAGMERENLKLKVEVNNLRSHLEKKNQEAQSLEQKVAHLENSSLPEGEKAALKQKLEELLEKINKHIPES